mmetsp:Transcript_8614/g.24771  ORF Transcript_8614/g.24771 Transcript_8614/m.24771 type:complete len:217 (+) Transcript_8614:7480-8130(+)
MSNAHDDSCDDNLGTSNSPASTSRAAIRVPPDARALRGLVPAKAIMFWTKPYRLILAGPERPSPNAWQRTTQSTHTLRNGVDHMGGGSTRLMIGPPADPIADPDADALPTLLPLLGLAATTLPTRTFCVMEDAVNAVMVVADVATFAKVDDAPSSFMSNARMDGAATSGLSVGAFRSSARKEWRRTSSVEDGIGDSTENDECMPFGGLITVLDSVP